MYNEDDSKWNFDAPHFWDLTGQTQQERPNDGWFNERNISGPSFPPRKKRRPLRTHTYITPTTETLPAKPPPKPRAIQEQTPSSSVFDRLDKSSTISFSKKLHPASEQVQPKPEKVKERVRKQEDLQHQLEESPSKETVSERITRLENACLDQGKINIFKKKDIKLKKSIDLANVLRYPVSNNWSSSQQHQSLYHEVNATKGQVEPAAISISSVNFQESHSPQWKHHDESSTQRRSLLDELKAFQHQQQQHSSPQRESVDHAPSNINQPTVQQSIHSDRPSLAEQVQDLQEKDQEDHSIEVTRNFFNNLIKENKEKIKEQEDKPIETTRNFFNSLLNEKPSNTNHLNTHEHINKQPEMPIINHTQPKFTDFSDTYQKIKQLREQIRQVSQPRSRNEFTETKRTREYEGSHFIDERIKRARKVLKASKEKRRKWLSKK